MPLPPRIIAADRGDAGRRIDLVLRRHLTDLSAATRTRVQTWIEDGRVQVNGRVVRRVASRTAFGDVVTIQFPDLQPRAQVLPEEVPIDVLFEDEYLAVVNKPAGLVSHPTYRNTFGTLVNALLGYATRWPAGRRPSLVGRLDKLTSGAVLVAKTADAHARLQRVLLSAHSEKSYLAVTYGEMPQRGEITLRLQRDPQDRRRVMASETEGVPSVTRYERVATAEFGREQVSLVRCRLVTGRTHQIRAHLSASGWPLVGDPVYGAPRWQGIEEAEAAAALQAFARQALHAWRLVFTHPLTQATVAVEAPMPDDLRALLGCCRLPVEGRRA